MPQINDPVLSPPKKKRPPAPFLTDTTATAIAAKTLAQRVGHFPPATVDTHPNTVASLAISGIPNYMIKTIGPKLEAAWRFVQERDTAGGQPGVLTPYRLAALSLPVDQQAAAHATINSLQQLTPDELQIVLASATAAVSSQGTLDPNESEFNKVVGGAAGLVGIVGHTIGAGFHAIGTGLDTIHAGGLHTALDYGLGKVEQGLTVAGRGAEELVAIPLEALSQVQDKPTNWSDTLQFWNMKKDDPLTQASFDIAGQDINAPENQRLRTSLNFLAGFGGQVAFGELLGGAGELLHKPYESGGLVRSETWANSPLGDHFFGKVNELLSKTPEKERIGTLLAASEHADPLLARDLVDAFDAGGGVANLNGALNAMRRAFVDHVTDVPTDARIADVRDNLRGVTDKLLDEHIAPDEQAFFEGEKLRLEKLLQNLTNDQGQFRWPKVNSIRGVFKGAPGTSWVSKVVDAIYPDKPSGVDLTKLTDNLPHSSPIWSPLDPRRPVDWLDHNADVLGKILRAAGVDRPTIAVRIGEMLRVDTRGAYFKWLDSMADDISLAARDSVPPDVIHQATRWFRTPEEARIRAPLTEDAVTPDGRTVSATHNVLETPSGKPLPTQENEYAATARTPNMQAIKEVSSAVRESERHFLRGYPSRFVKGLTHVATGISRPLIVAIKGPAIFLGIQVDQALTNLFFGYNPVDAIGRGVSTLYRKGISVFPGGVPVDTVEARAIAQELLTPTTSIDTTHGIGMLARSTVGRLLSTDAPVSGTDLGQIVSDLTTEPTEYVQSPIGSFADRFMRQETTVAENIAVSNGLFYELDHLRSSRMVRSLAADGPEITATRMLNPRISPELNDFYTKQLKPTLDEAGVSLPDFLDAKMRQLEQIAGGDPRLMEAISSGKWTVRDQVPTGAGDEYLLAQDELAQVTEAIKAQPNGTIRAELYRHRSDILDQLDAMDTGAKDYISMEDKSAVAGALLDRARTGDYQFPPRVLKEIPRSILTGDESAIRTGAMARYQRIMYGALRPMSKADILLTRGSLFEQSFSKAYMALREAGWPEDRAVAAAQARASFVVRDLLHDLGNKTSFQRTLANEVPFLPAWQKSLYRWFYKIPERIGGGFGAASLPVGYALEANMLKEVTGLLKSSGVMQTVTEPDGSKHDVLVIPNPARLLDWIPGLHVMPNQAVVSDPGHLLIALRFIGGEVPGLSPQAQFALGAAASKFGGAFKTLNNIVTIDGAFTPQIPGSALLTRVWETAFGEVPPWLIGASKKFQEYVVNRAHDAALRYAFTELAKQGIKPPNPADYSDKSSYYDARDKYWGRLDSTANESYLGIGVTYLLSSVASPASFTPTTQEEQAWKKFLATNGLTGERTAEDYALIDKHLGPHPESLAFNVSMYTPDSKWPKTDTGYQQFKAAISRGDIQVQTYDQYRATVALAQEWSYRDEAAHRALVAAGLGNWNNMSAVEKLANQGKYIAATQDSWDNFSEFLDGNKAASDLYNANQSDAGKAFDKIHEIEASRYDLISAGKNPDKMEQAVYDQLAKATGYGKTEDEHVAWYKADVMNGYYDKTHTIYAQIDKVKASGDPDTSAQLNALYDQLRKVNNSYTGGVKKGGETYPSPQEYQFSKLTPKQQDAKVQGWAQEPPAWLSEYEFLTTYGQAAGPQVQTYFEYEKNVQASFDKGTAKLSTSSNEYAAWKTWQAKALAYGAQKIGATAVAVQRLEAAPPVVRMDAAGTLPAGPNMAWIVENTRIVAHRIAAHGYSVTGTSAYAEYERGVIEGRIDQMRDPSSKYYDRAVDVFWTRQANDTGITDDHALYRKVLFGAEPSFTIRPDYTAEDSTARKVS